MSTKISAQRRKKVSAQYLAWYIHSLFGLKLTLILSVVLISGGLAVLDREIDWLIHPEIRAEALPNQTALNPGEIADKLQAYDPSLSIYYVRTFPEQPYLAALADIDRPDGSWALVWVDPYTGEVNGEIDYSSVGNFIAQLHGDLFLPYGRMIVNFTGVLVLVSLITGLIALPKFWRHFFRLPRTATARVFLGDLHKLIGLWSLWIVLFISLSGTWWFYNYPLVSELSAPQLLDERPSKPLLEHKDIPPMASFRSGAELVAAAQAAYPDVNFTILQPPEHNADLYTLRGLSSEWLVTRWSSNKVYMNPYTAEIVASDRVSDTSAGQRIDMALSALHYGNWGYGTAILPVKVLWCVGGLAMGFLSVSGMLINYKRASKASKKLKKYIWADKILPALNTEKGQINWRTLRPWGGPMGRFKYLNIVLIAGAIIGAPKFFAGAPSQEGWYIYPEKALGPWTVSAFAKTEDTEQKPIVIGKEASLKVNLSFNAQQNIKFIYARVDKPRTLRAPGVIIHGPVNAKHVHLPIPKRTKATSELWITAETWDGQFFQTHWPLFP